MVRERVDGALGRARLAPVLLALLLLGVGAVVLYLGAEAAVRGAAGLASALGIPAFLVGALLFGIDLEGLGTAVAASARGATALAVGHIFGAVLFLFSAAFGAALLLGRRQVPSPSPVMVLAPAAPLIAASAALADRYVTRLEGVLLVALYAAYVTVVIREGRLDTTRTGDAAGGVRPALAGLAVGGLLLVALGSAVLVTAALRLSTAVGLSHGFVGAAVLGILVSLDEVVLEVLPIRRGVPELATGNLFGTLAAFSSGVLGVAALVRPLLVDSAANLAVLGSAFLYALVATVFLVRGRAGPVLGIVVLTFYAAWLVMVSSI
jgi:cation:H+ antiporter